MKITIYELMGLVKDGKAPKKIKFGNIELEYDEGCEDYFFYGLTTLSKQRVLLNKDIHIERKKKTLYHELMHVYKDVFIGNEEWKISEEELCDISACSHDIIHKIVEDYFKGDN